MNMELCVCCTNEQGWFDVGSAARFQQPTSKVSGVNLSCESGSFKIGKGRRLLNQEGRHNLYIIDWVRGTFRIASTSTINHIKPIQTHEIVRNEIQFHHSSINFNS